MRTAYVWLWLGIVSCTGAAAADGAAAAEGGLVLVESGKSTFSIYHEGDAPSSVRDAARDLWDCLRKATGVMLPLVEGGEVPAGPFIALGRTRAAEAAGLADGLPTGDGYRIATRGGNLFILGTDTPDGRTNELGGVGRGTVNGVAAFCEDFLGARWVLPGDLGEEVPRVDSVTIAPVDRVGSSPFVYRNLDTIGGGDGVARWERHLKLGQVAAVQHSHAWEKTIPTTAFEAHPEWFAEVGGRRIPPSGRYKLETTEPGLVQAYADAVIAAFRADDSRRWYSLSPSDGGGWSESPASRALHERDPHGARSVTPLVLKFYNDVARIVGREFPDRFLGGYIYADYLYPPSSGLPKMEPNLALVVATSISYGFRLYRADVREEWDRLMRAWGECARAGVDLYYYDLPTALKQDVGIITPPAPEIVNFIFPRLKRYGFKGAYINGRSIWPAYSAGNYLLARSMWDPDADASAVLREYLRVAYGPDAAPHMEELHATLDRAFRDFYNAHPRESYNLTPAFLDGLYGPNYRALEAHYLRALAAVIEPRQRRRLELFGQVLSLLQWNLKAQGALPTDFTSPLTVDDEAVDRYFSSQGTGAGDDETYGPSRASGRRGRERAPAVVPARPLVGGEAGRRARAPVVVPLRSLARVLLRVDDDRDGEVDIRCEALESRAEFARFTVRDGMGKEVQAGALRPGRVIRFAGRAGETYRLDVDCTWASYRLAIEGAAVAYKADPQSRGLRVDTHAVGDGGLSLDFYVPAGAKTFYALINGGGVTADLTSPSGRPVARIDTTEASPARAVVSGGDARPGFWTLTLHRPPGRGERPVYVVLDPKLPQWFSVDPEHPLKIDAPD